MTATGERPPIAEIEAPEAPPLTLAERSERIRQRYAVMRQREAVRIARAELLDRLYGDEDDDDA